jgi:cell division protein FtsN
VGKVDDGILLPNLWLLVAFFFVLLLVSVAFAMGYIVGEVASEAKMDTKLAVGAPSRPLDAAPVETVGAQKKPSIVTQAPKADPETARSEPVKPLVAKPAKAPQPRASSRLLYLQLSATTQHGAENLVVSLSKKGFKAIAAEIEEKPGTFRVLVGPLTDDSATDRMRSDLDAAGFAGRAAVPRRF